MKIYRVSYNWIDSYPIDRVYGYYLSREKAIENFHKCEAELLDFSKYKSERGCYNCYFKMHEIEEINVEE